MTTDRWERVSDIFERAASFHGVERERFIAEVCGDDAELRDELESLLEHDERASADFMRIPDNREGAGAGDDEPVGPDPIIGQRIGGCDVKSVLAAGGMGTVYLAEQESPRRDVAIKLMRMGMGSRNAARRFEYESQILAHLRHPHIAHVHAAGTHRDPTEPGRPRPYFVMEYVPDALPITDFAERGDLSVDERLEIFLQLCDAIHHGHQKGVIHRDIKPANVLVDSDGQVKVIDFGVARATDSELALTTLQTEMGRLMGTVQYMSPEQWEADPHRIDTRSDVYSLGVVLYELLCGKPPYDLTGTPIHRAAHVVRESVPPPPGESNRSLRGDLEPVILKALEKEPARRYQSVVELAQDIRRHLRGAPVEARPPRRWTKAHRWIVRHPGLAMACVVGMVVGLLTTAITLGIGSWYWFERPDRIVLSADKRAAVLLSVSGNPLHSWGGSAAVPVIAFSGYVRQPAEFGGRQLAVVVHTPTGEAALPVLCLYDVAGDLEVPYRILKLDDESVPQSLLDKGRAADSFAVHGGMIEDFFPDAEHPGDEILVYYSCTYSQRAIRIYDTRGELLYQVWHDGAVGMPYWMSGVGQLAFVGDYAGADLYLDQLGIKFIVDAGVTRYPSVVFAIQPEAGSIEKRFLDLGAHPGVDDPLAPAWYAFLLPPRVKDMRMVGIGAPSLPHDPHARVGVLIQHGDSPILAVCVVLGSDGRPVPGSSPITPDSYRSRRLRDPESLPDPESIAFGTWMEFLDLCPNAQDLSPNRVSRDGADP